MREGSFHGPLAHGRPAQTKRGTNLKRTGVAGFRLSQSQANERGPALNRDRCSMAQLTDFFIHKFRWPCEQHALLCPPRAYGLYERSQSTFVLVPCILSHAQLVPQLVAIGWAMRNVARTVLRGISKGRDDSEKEKGGKGY